MVVSVRTIKCDVGLYVLGDNWFVVIERKVGALTVCEILPLKPEAAIRLRASLELPVMQGRVM
jgi:hypothetical protein